MEKAQSNREGETEEGDERVWYHFAQASAWDQTQQSVVDETAVQHEHQCISASPRDQMSDKQLAVQCSRIELTNFPYEKDVESRQAIISVIEKKE